MDNFNYKNDTKIIFGKDNYSEIGKNIKIFFLRFKKIGYEIIIYIFRK